MKKKKLTGVILAGGKNSRMGADKGLLQVDGKKIAQRIIEVLQTVADEIIIISNGNNYNSFGCKVFPDIISGCGPMSGIHTALCHSATEKILVIACDMPFIKKNTLEKLTNDTSAEITVPEINGEIQPLCAVYSTVCMNRFSRLLAKGEWRMNDAFSYFEIKKIKFRENDFGNINTPEDYQKLKNKNYEHTS